MTFKIIYIGKPPVLKIAFSLICIASSGITLAAVPEPAQFVQCAVCHQTARDARSTIGPNLAGLSGRVVGTLPGYTYSAAMKGAGGKWTRARLAAFITNPRQTLPGTKMAYVGQRDPKVAAAIADFVLSLK
jgi:cytochrome c